MSSPHHVPRKIWILYRVRTGAAGDPDAGASTTAAGRRRLRAFSTPEGAQSAAATDEGSGEDLRWERWNRRLVSETRDGVAYTIERYDVLEN